MTGAKVKDLKDRAKWQNSSSYKQMAKDEVKKKNNGM